MAFPLQEKYVNLLTDFGFKRVFGTEPNQQLLIDFLNTLLPTHHRIQSVSYKRTENLGNTPLDRKAIFDIYCQAENGERFIVEIQKAKQNFFKDRSVYYATFPIQEQALKGEWNYQLTSVYTVGVLDFIFDDHREDAELLHTVKLKLKNQHCQVFYDKLTFIYIELPKFKKTLAELETHFEKWLYLLRHLPDLQEPPSTLQASIFLQLFEVAEIANFSPAEQETYQNSLKYYRDLNNVVDTSRQEGIEQGLQQGLQEGIQQGLQQGIQLGAEQARSRLLECQRSLLLRQLYRQLGQLPEALTRQVNQLSLETLDELAEVLFDWTEVADLSQWLRLKQHEGE